ncbi:MAG TPA: hypothetical protein ENN43_01390 [bacterium]|nr:hypothetical protein [bacterium]
MMRIYSFVFSLLLVLFSPVILAGALVSKKWREWMLERAGIYPGSLREKIKGKKIIWFHAASVGEVQALAPVVRELKSLRQGRDIVVTTTSVNGRRKIEKELSDTVLFTAILPFDTIALMSRFIDMINPEAVIIVETELWPSLIKCVSDEKIPLILVNGRISVKSFGLYRALGFFFARLIERFSALIVQSEKIQKRMLRMGVRHKKMMILDNTKYSSGGGAARFLYPKEDALKNRVVVAAGSIREGEEGVIIEGFAASGAGGKLLIIAPRRLKRARECAAFLKKQGLSYILWSALKDRKKISEYDAVIVDTMGELSRIYGMADIAIIGGGFRKLGGHNPMEAAYAGLPMIFGKYMFNFEDTADRFVREGGAITADFSADGVAAAVRELAENSGRRSYMGEKNRSIVEKFVGSGPATAFLVNEIILESGAEKGGSRD